MTAIKPKLFLRANQALATMANMEPETLVGQKCCDVLQWMVMRKHPVYTYEMLSRIEYLRPAIAIPYCHHEKSIEYCCVVLNHQTLYIIS
jgi:hypothetical protein